MGKIRQLDSQTTNLIAAGEVVERPMGVVKELVENAIDASSTRITIAIEEGGLKKITITDNGTGMDSADAEMCFQRHATSKIHGQNDLWTIHTLGFRGEALPSIAAVAKVTLTTSNGEDATRVVMAYGKTESVSPYPCSKGTEIQVEGLFYHTPARLKHMRSASYEASLIQDVISRFALSHPEIAFRFINEGRDAFRTSGQGSLQEVVYSVYGRGAAENAIPVDFSDFDYHVHGYLIAPSITRATRNMMHIFLNGRMVKTYKLYQSVQEGYHEFIPKGRCPMCVLLVEMDPHLLDVNVHPSKWEVRISKEVQLEVLIKDQVEKALKEKGAVRESAEAEDKPARTTYYQPLSFDDLDLRAAYPSAGSGYKSHKQTVEKEETAETTDKKETDQNTTAITGLSHLDPDTQAAIRKEAERISDTYHVQILYGDLVPLSYKDYTVSTLSDPEKVLDALGVLDRTLSIYPPGFFSSVKEGYCDSINICLAQNLRVISMRPNLETAGAFTTVQDDAVWLVLNADEALQPGSLIHELTHVTDYRLLGMHQLEESEWNRLNPSGFSYFNAYLDEDGNDLRLTGSREYTALFEELPDRIWFWDPYGKTFAMEDRARLMEILLENAVPGSAENVSHDSTAFDSRSRNSAAGISTSATPAVKDARNRFLSSPHVRTKYRFYFYTLRQAFERAGWPQETVWESELKSAVNAENNTP